jgi:glycosyltransferase involved in cell wall biosynthesis
MHGRAAVWYWQTIQPRMARAADVITTLSRHAAEDIHQYLGVSESRIEIVPCASRFAGPPSPGMVAEIRRRLDLPERYVLSVGILARWKNFGTLIEAFGLLRAAGTPIPTLVLAGPRYPQSDGSSIFSQIAGLGLADSVRYLGPVPDEDLPALYAGAELYVAPSITEGFGITCLEAMACGAPVIAARASATPEVVGDGGVLVDEYLSPAGWASAIADLLGNPAKREALRAVGQARARAFRWADSADRVLAIYDRLLGVEAPQPVR